MKGPAILFVEDDEAMRRAVTLNLTAHGYRVVEVADAASASRALEAGRPDLVLLDLGLPDADGTTVIRHLRREATTPVLVLTARGAEREKVNALDAGADDYVTKPFGMDELHARIRALLRRAAGPASDQSGLVRIGRLEVDGPAHEVRVGGEIVHLTPREFDVLRVLVEYAGRVVTHGRLLRAVWGGAYDDEAHYLHVYVSQIRQKLAAADATGRLAALIESVPGVGYRVRIEPDEESGAGGTGGQPRSR